jgi:hypothetical protein
MASQTVRLFDSWGLPAEIPPLSLNLHRELNLNLRTATSSLNCQCYFRLADHWTNLPFSAL